MPYKDTDAAELAELEAEIAKLDAPKTPAPEAKKAPAKKSNSNSVLFISTDPEPQRFSIQVAGDFIRPTRDPKGLYNVWRVPNDLVERFELHHHVARGRIIRKKD